MTATDTTPPGDTAGGVPATAPARLVIALAAVFLGAGALLFLGSVSRLLWPEAITESGLLSYGRLLPGATALLLGWLLLAALGGAWYVMPRIGGKEGTMVSKLTLSLVLVAILFLAACGAPEPTVEPPTPTSESSAGVAGGRSGT